MARFVAVFIAMLFVSISVPNDLIAVENASWGEIKAISAQNDDPNTPVGKLVVSATKAGGMRNTSKPSITVLSPNGGENWVLGSTQTIEWSSKNVSKVSLWFCQDNTCGRIGVGVLPSTGIPNTGSYTFTVGTDVTPFGAYVPSEDLKIRIASEDSYPVSTVYDDSDETFDVVEDQRIFSSMPTVEALPLHSDLNVNETTTIFMFKITTPPSAHNEWVELRLFVFKIMGEGVYPRSLQLWAYDDVNMTITANYGFNPYIPIRKHDLVGGFLSVVEPFPGDICLSVPPGRTKYFRLSADLLRFHATDNLEISLSEVNFQIRRGK